MGQGWEDRASSWIAWARRPGFDGYWAYRETFLREVLPHPGTATLEIGCGEGRVARDTARLGHSVTAIDASPTLVAAGAGMDSNCTYRVAQAEDLPFADGSFDVVVAYNSLMDVANMQMAVREAARVLRDGGVLAVCVTHPISDAGTFTDDSANAPFVIEGSYRGQRPVGAIVARDGLRMDFGGGHALDLESYSRAFDGAGFLIQRLREPAPDSRIDVSQRGIDRGRRIPYFLMLRLIKCTLPF
jgi:SAM-dependent methyltransferase